MFFRPLTSKRLALKTAAWLVLSACVTRDAAFAEMAAAWPEKAAARENSAFRVPAELGTSTAAYKGTGDETVLHIRDAHDSLEAQEKITGLLETLAAQYDVTTVALEGSSGDIDASIFRSYPDKKVSEAAAKELMAQGRLSAGELYAATTPREVAVYGAEDVSLYAADLEAFRRLHQVRREAEPHLAGLERTFEELAERVYGREIRELRAASPVATESERSFIGRWNAMESLAAAKGVTFSEFENLSALARIAVLEKEIDFPAANRERETLLERLKGVASRDELNGLVKDSLEFKASKLGDVEFHLRVAALASRHGVPAGDFPNFSRYASYAALFDSMDLTRVFDEFARFDTKIRHAYFASPDEEELDRLETEFGLAAKLVRGEATSSEYARFRASRTSFDAASLSARLEALMRRHGVPTYGRMEPKQLLSYLPVAEDFYEKALLRDKALVERTVAKMRADKKRSAVLVAGGFHTQGISELLTGRNLSHVVILPQITDPNRKRPYVTVLTRRPAAFAPPAASADKSGIGFGSPLATEWDPNTFDEGSRLAYVRWAARDLRRLPKEAREDRLNRWMARLRREGRHPGFTADWVEERVRAMAGMGARFADEEKAAAKKLDAGDTRLEVTVQTGEAGPHRFRVKNLSTFEFVYENFVPTEDGQPGAGIGRLDENAVYRIQVEETDETTYMTGREISRLGIGALNALKPGETRSYSLSYFAETRHNPEYTAALRTSIRRYNRYGREARLEHSLAAWEVARALEDEHDPRTFQGIFENLVDAVEADPELELSDLSVLFFDRLCVSPRLLERFRSHLTTIALARPAGATRQERLRAAHLAEAAVKVKRGGETGEVVIVSDQYLGSTGAGGLGLYAFDLAEELGQEGIKVTVITPVFQNNKDSVFQRYNARNTGRWIDIKYNADGSEVQRVHIHEAKIGKVRVLYQENARYYPELDEVYKRFSGKDRLRFSRMLSYGAPLTARVMNVHPTVFHTNEWGGAYLKAALQYGDKHMPPLVTDTHFVTPLGKKTEVLFGTHNLESDYLGMIDPGNEDDRNQMVENDLCLPANASWSHLLFRNPKRDMRWVIHPVFTAIETADQVVTVSEPYHEYSLEMDNNDDIGGTVPALKHRKAEGRYSPIPNGFGLVQRQREMLNGRAFIENGSDTSRRREMRRFLDEHKPARKRELQKSFGLEQDKDAFVYSMLHRIGSQKGFQLLLSEVWDMENKGIFRMTGSFGRTEVGQLFESYNDVGLSQEEQNILTEYATRTGRRKLRALEVALLLEPKLQVIIVGGVGAENSSDPYYEGLKDIEDKFHDSFDAASLGRKSGVFRFQSKFIAKSDPKYALIYEGSDGFGMPSKREPGGYSQREAHAAGTVSLTTENDGLRDTLIEVEETDATGEQLEGGHTLASGFREFNPVRWLTHLRGMRHIYSDPAIQYVDADTGLSWSLWQEAQYRAIIQDNRWKGLWRTASGRSPRDWRSPLDEYVRLYHKASGFPARDMRRLEVAATLNVAQLRGEQDPADALMAGGYTTDDAIEDVVSALTSSRRYSNVLLSGMPRHDRRRTGRRAAAEAVPAREEFTLVRFLARTGPVATRHLLRRLEQELSHLQNDDADPEVQERFRQAIEEVRIPEGEAEAGARLALAAVRTVRRLGPAISLLASPPVAAGWLAGRTLGSRMARLSAMEELGRMILSAQRQSHKSISRAAVNAWVRKNRRELRAERSRRRDSRVLKTRRDGNPDERNEEIAAFRYEQNEEPPMLAVMNLSDQRQHGWVAFDHPENFGFENDEKRYYLFDDFSGNTYLHSGADLVKRGLYVQLPAGGSHSFEVRELLPFMNGDVVVDRQALDQIYMSRHLEGEPRRNFTPHGLTAKARSNQPAIRLRIFLDSEGRVTYRDFSSFTGRLPQTSRPHFDVDGDAGVRALAELMTVMPPSVGEEPSRRAMYDEFMTWDISYATKRYIQQLAEFRAEHAELFSKGWLKKLDTHKGNQANFTDGHGVLAYAFGGKHDGEDVKGLFAVNLSLSSDKQYTFLRMPDIKDPEDPDSWAVDQTKTYLAYNWLPTLGHDKHSHNRYPDRDGKNLADRNEGFPIGLVSYRGDSSDPEQRSAHLFFLHETESPSVVSHIHKDDTSRSNLAGLVSPRGRIGSNSVVRVPVGEKLSFEVTVDLVDSLSPEQAREVVVEAEIDQTGERVFHRLSLVPGQSEGKRFRFRFGRSIDYPGMHEVKVRARVGGSAELTYISEFRVYAPMTDSRRLFGLEKREAIARRLTGRMYPDLPAEWREKEYVVLRDLLGDIMDTGAIVANSLGEIDVHDLSKPEGNADYGYNWPRDSLGILDDLQEIYEETGDADILLAIRRHLNYVWHAVESTHQLDSQRWSIGRLAPNQADPEHPVIEAIVPPFKNWRGRQKDGPAHLAKAALAYLSSGDTDEITAARSRILLRRSVDYMIENVANSYFFTVYRSLPPGIPDERWTNWWEEKNGLFAETHILYYSILKDLETLAQAHEKEDPRAAAVNLRQADWDHLRETLLAPVRKVESLAVRPPDVHPAALARHVIEQLYDTVGEESGQRRPSPTIRAVRRPSNDSVGADRLDSSILGALSMADVSPYSVFDPIVIGTFNALDEPFGREGLYPITTRVFPKLSDDIIRFWGRYGGLDDTDTYDGRRNADPDNPAENHIRASPWVISTLWAVLYELEFVRQMQREGRLNLPKDDRGFPTLIRFFEHHGLKLELKPGETIGRNDGRFDRIVDAVLGRAERTIDALVFLTGDRSFPEQINRDMYLDAEGRPQQAFRGAMPLPWSNRTFDRTLRVYREVTAMLPEPRVPHRIKQYAPKASRLAEHKYYALYKKQDTLSNFEDPDGLGRRTVYEDLAEQVPGIDLERVFLLGRLDANVGGLLVFSDDPGTGVFLIPAAGSEKTYRVTISSVTPTAGAPDAALDDLNRKLDILKRGVTIVAKKRGTEEQDTFEVTARDNSTAYRRGDELVLDLVIDRGVQYQVKAMMAEIGYTKYGEEYRFERIGSAGLRLEELGLKPGQARELTAEETSRLVAAKQKAFDSFHAFADAPELADIPGLDPEQKERREMGRTKAAIRQLLGLTQVDVPDIGYFVEDELIRIIERSIEIDRQRKQALSVLRPRTQNILGTLAGAFKWPDENIKIFLRTFLVRYSSRRAAQLTNALIKPLRDSDPENPYFADEMIEMVALVLAEPGAQIIKRKIVDDIRGKWRDLGETTALTRLEAAEERARQLRRERSERRRGARLAGRPFVVGVTRFEDAAFLRERLGGLEVLEVPARDPQHAMETLRGVAERRGIEKVYLYDGAGGADWNTITQISLDRFAHQVEAETGEFAGILDGSVAIESLTDAEAEKIAAAVFRFLPELQTIDDMPRSIRSTGAGRAAQLQDAIEEIRLRAFHPSFGYDFTGARVLAASAPRAVVRTLDSLDAMPGAYDYRDARLQEAGITTPFHDYLAVEPETTDEEIRQSIGEENFARFRDRVLRVADWSTESIYASIEASGLRYSPENILFVERSNSQLPAFAQKPESKLKILRVGGEYPVGVEKAVVKLLSGHPDVGFPGLSRLAANVFEFIPTLPVNFEHLFHSAYAQRTIGSAA